jgi:hypothetical protein
MVVFTCGLVGGRGWDRTLVCSPEARDIALSLSETRIVFLRFGLVCVMQWGRELTLYRKG